MINISYIEFCGFRGYKEKLRLDFVNGYNIISGRNGVGKSTIFDAIEFALTGSISKYEGIKSNKESIANYTWWRGKEDAEAYYVEIGLQNSKGELFIFKREKENGSSDIQSTSGIEALICNPSTAPSSPVKQLCRTSIIRDESISALSLDLNETERFKILRDALGSFDADIEIERASDLKTLCLDNLRVIDANRESTRNRLKEANARIEELRARMAEENELREAEQYLKIYSSVDLTAEELLNYSKGVISAKRSEIEKLQLYIEELSRQKSNQSSLEKLKERWSDLQQQLELKSRELESATLEYDEFTLNGSDFESELQMTAQLVDLGEELGLREDLCPLCSSKHTQQSFSRGIALSRAEISEKDIAAKRLNDRKVQLEKNIKKLKEEKLGLDLTTNSVQDEMTSISRFSSRLESLIQSMPPQESSEPVILARKLDTDKQLLAKAEFFMRMLDNTSLKNMLDSATVNMEEIKSRLAELEIQTAKARKAAAAARSLYDTVRRSANEALDDRLSKLGPLLSDLYRRLKPHSLWRDIDYKIRGDVTRLLSLEVGDGLNPQFIFSSGQRRATGLAFLISIYLTTSWSKLGTLMLDDPVQHIDDFRALHLAELLASLQMGSRQIICSVEDTGLANLLSRRLMINPELLGKHIQLSEKVNGALGIQSETIISNAEPYLLKYA